MALSEDEKTRIREEELLRLQTREEFRIMHRHTRPQDHVNTVVFLIIFAVVFAGMWMVVRSGKQKRVGPGPAASVYAIPGIGSAAQA